jgi:acyl carrier protein
MEGIEETLRHFLAENILFSGNGYPYPDEGSLLENGVVDSMSVMELVLFVEKTFSLTIGDREIIPANFDSVRSLATFVRSKLAEHDRGASRREGG